MQIDSSKPDIEAGTSRREFLKKTATVGAVVASSGFLKTPVYGQSQAPSANVQGANDRIVVGYVGVGNQGFGTHVRQMKDHAKELNITQGAVCDVFDKYRNRAQAHTEVGADSVYSDHRKLMERKDIDAVVIATVDHWHAPVAIDAVKSGKHVLVEKPMTRYLNEAFALYDAVKCSGKSFQIGAVFCQEAKWHKAAEIIKAGTLGPLVLGQSSYCRNTPSGEWNYAIDPDLNANSVDWKRWLGQTGWRDFNADHYFRWRKYHPYCAGILGDLLAHKIHPLMIASGTPEFPRRVSCLGTRKITTDRDVPDNTQLLAEFPSGYTILVLGSTVNDLGLDEVIRGHHGTLELGGDRVNLVPQRAFADDLDPESHSGLRPSGADFVAEYHDWCSSIRNGHLTKGNIELSIRAQVVITLSEMSERLNHTLLFDETTRKVTTGNGQEVTLPGYPA